MRGRRRLRKKVGRLSAGDIVWAKMWRNIRKRMVLVHVPGGRGFWWRWR